MPTDLLNAAISSEDSDSHTDVEAAAGPTSNTDTAGMIVACGGAPKRDKTKRQYEPTTPAKRTKVDPTFTPPKRKPDCLECVFVGEELIPLWPQYCHVKKEEGRFLRVSSQESWVMQMVVALRRVVLRGYKPQGQSEDTKPFSKTLVRFFVLFSLCFLIVF